MFNNYRTGRKLHRKLIYVIGIPPNYPDYNFYKGYLKIGDTTEPKDKYEYDNNDPLLVEQAYHAELYKPNDPALIKKAYKRGKQYLETSGINFKVYYATPAYNSNSGHYFRDYDIHRVLERSGYHRYKHTEWFKVSLDTAKRAIKAVKQNLKVIPKVDHSKITFRPEQKHFIKRTDKYFRLKSHKAMLWNAKMRFGKTLCALEVAKDMKYKRILIATHRPVVNDGWFGDFIKLLGDNPRYSYGSKDKGDTLHNLLHGNHRFFYFVSLQDLVGSKYAGGNINKDYDIFNTTWDLLIIDEAHEGTQTQKASNVDQNLTYSKKLLLSGTPFNIIYQYGKDQVCTWDYIMEQHAKKEWEKKHGDKNNPYSVLPTVSMYTFHMGFKNYPRFYDPYSQMFNFNKFFHVEDNGHFTYEPYVKQFLNLITEPNPNTNYPYSKPAYCDNIRHSLWILPSIKSAAALEKLMKQNSVFSNFRIINAVENNDNYNNDDNDADKVERIIEQNDYTITLTVRKLTLGVTIPQWTAVVFLSDTNSTAQYLQAAFRAQSPYFDKKRSKQKTHCYIFDFAPERALSMMSRTVSLNPSRKGSLTRYGQKQELSKLLHFLPVIGERGNSLQRYHIETLLQTLKKAYAERAVNSGFDDTSLYRHNFLENLTVKDIEHLKHAESVVGMTKSNRRKNKKFIISDNGLNTKDYQIGINKPKKKQTSAEQKAINKARNRREGIIAILRSISIRIPLMIYGIKIKFSDDITIKDFTNLVDDQSWDEFMPNGISKQDFNDLAKFYNPDVFIEAGKIIRYKVKDIDNNDPLERTNQIAELFSHFRNPDKETVLTPWNVVNMHLSKTLGGLTHYNYTGQIHEKEHWISHSSKLIFNPNVHVLEINSKTGLYPLYMASSLYYQAMQGGPYSPKEKQRVWYQILDCNIYMIAKTKMAKRIATRTLLGYKHHHLHIIYEDHLVKNSKKNLDYEVKRIEKRFNNMKFDVVIGNPPYQQSYKGANNGAIPIYPYFVNLSEKLSSHYVSLIIKARWYAGGGRKLSKFRSKMLNDKHIKVLYDFATAADIFPHTEIKGGLTIFLWDKKYDNSSKGVRVVNVSNNHITGDTYRPLKTGNLNIFIRDSKAVNILSKISHEKSYISQTVSSFKPFHLPTTFRNSKYFQHNKNNNSLVCYANTHKRLIHGYVNKEEFLKNLDPNGKYLNAIDQWKIFTPRFNALGTEAPDDHFQTIIGKPGTICTESYAMIGYNLHLNKQSINNLAKYLKTKFSRYLVSVAKTSHDAPRGAYKFIPLQNFTNDSDIDWNKSLSNIDQQLFNKYKFNNKQCKYINKSIKDQA